jgi:hypothetical protein
MEIEQREAQEREIPEKLYIPGRLRFIGTTLLREK